MNSVSLIGRLTRDPELRYAAGTQMAITRFSIAIDRPTRQGEERKTDFPTIVVFGKQAETCEKYLSKGRISKRLIASHKIYNIYPMATKKK